MVYYRVIDPVKAIVAIRDYEEAIPRIAQTTLRASLGRHELDDLLANQETINEQLKTQIDIATEEWGVQVVAVETKDLDLPESMQRAMPAKPKPSASAVPRSSPPKESSKRPSGSARPPR